MFTSIRSRRLLLTGALAAAAVGAAVVAGSGASAQTPTAARTVTFTELDKGDLHALVDLPPKSHAKGEPIVSRGDQLVYSTPLQAATGKGKLYARCAAVTTATLFKARFACDGFFTLPDGTMTFQTLITIPKGQYGVITGGTGAYANARGTFTAKGSKIGAVDTITLAG
jgi:hypothetical protein